MFSRDNPLYAKLEAALALAPPEHHEVREREIDGEARADRQQLAGPHRHEQRRDQHRRRVRQEARDLRERKRRIGSRFQPAA